jgi:hypothetical protein
MAELRLELVARTQGKGLNGGLSRAKPALLRLTSAYGVTRSVCNHAVCFMSPSAVKIDTLCIL